MHTQVAYASLSNHEHHSNQNPPGVCSNGYTLRKDHPFHHLHNGPYVTQEILLPLSVRILNVVPAKTGRHRSNLHESLGPVTCWSLIERGSAICHSGVQASAGIHWPSAHRFCGGLGGNSSRDAIGYAMCAAQIAWRGCLEGWLTIVTDVEGGRGRTRHFVSLPI